MIVKFFRLEFRKQINSSTFWILVILHGLVLVMVSTNINGFLNNIGMAINDVPEADFSLSPILQFPDIWQNLTYIASYFKIILAIIIIISITSEFSSGTARQNIIDGLSRKQWLATKIGLVKALALYSTLLIIIICLIVGFSQEGAIQLTDLMKRTEFVLAYFIELFTYFIYALFIALLLKRTGLSIILLLVYDFVIEPIISWSMPDKIAAFLPMNAIDNLNKFPFVKYIEANSQQDLSIDQMIWAIAYAIGFTFFSYLVLNKKDL